MHQQEINLQALKFYFIFFFQDKLVELAKEEASSISNLIAQATK